MARGDLEKVKKRKEKIERKVKALLEEQVETDKKETQTREGRYGANDSTKEKGEGSEQGARAWGGAAGTEGRRRRAHHNG